MPAVIVCIQNVYWDFDQPPGGRRGGKDVCPCCGGPVLVFATEQEWWDAALSVKSPIGPKTTRWVLEQMRGQHWQKWTGLDEMDRLRKSDEAASLVAADLAGAKTIAEEERRILKMMDELLRSEGGGFGGFTCVGEQADVRWLLEQQEKAEHHGEDSETAS